MLKKQEVAAIMPLAGMLTERGASLETIPGSPINGLVMCSASINPGSSDPESVLLAVTSPQNTGREDSEGKPIVLPSEHGFTKKRTVDCIAKGVQEIVANARGIVIPAINLTRDAVIIAMDEGTKAKTVLPGVDVYNYDPIYSSVLVDGIANQYQQVNLIGMPTLQLPDLSDEQLHALVNSGSQEVRDFIAREDAECPGHLSAIWQIWFQGRPVSNTDDFVFLSRMLMGGNDNTRLISAGLMNESIDARKGYDSIMVAFLLANALYDNPVEGATWGMDLDSYNMAMSAFRAHFGKVISRVYLTRVTAMESKILVINMPVAANWQLGERTDNVLLNGDVYKWYLESGGTIEAVIGNVFGQRAVSGRTILDLRPQFEAEYEKVVSGYAGLGVSNRHRMAIITLTEALINHVRNINDELWVRIHPDTTRLQIIQGIQTYLASGQPIGTTEGLNQVIMYVYSQIIYGRLRTDTFIQAMNNYPDQSLTPKVIAAHVIMDMVIKSLMNDIYYNLNE